MTRWGSDGNHRVQLTGPLTHAQVGWDGLPRCALASFYVVLRRSLELGNPHLQILPFPRSHSASVV